MNIKEIKEFINLMNEHNLQELEIEREGMRIKIKKMPSGKLETIEEVVSTLPKASMASKAEEESSKAAKKLISIDAPMVGTFYRAPSPDAKPYAEIGQMVEVGQVVCIIEAMKLMNEIKSEVRGKIAEVLVENVSPIEFGQPLFMIEPVSA